MLAALLTLSMVGQGRPMRMVITPSNLPPAYHTPSNRKFPVVVSKKGSFLRGPKGFRVDLFAVGLNSPRSLLALPNGDVLVVESYRGRIKLLRDKDGSGVADTYTVLLGGLKLPYGIALHEGFLYVANTDSVVRYPFRPGQTRITSKPERIVTGIPSKGYRQHWTRNLVFDPAGKHFFLSVGSETNKSPEPLPRASILRFRSDGSGRQVFATGLRNPVGMAFRPGTQELWTTCVERDYMGDDAVPDFVTRVRQGDFFGWPWYYAGNHLDPQLADKNPPQKSVTVPDILVRSHSVPLGLVFYEGEMFPAEYRGDMFVAMRGSTDRSVMSGYHVIRVDFREGKPQPGYEEFIGGWIPDRTKRTVYGRPVGLAVWTDGSMLISDEAGHKIWRVTYGVP